jgi:hypothetical protein
MQRRLAGAGRSNVLGEESEIGGESAKRDYLIRTLPTDAAPGRRIGASRI